LVLQIAFAFFLDILIGDPSWFPHPVKGIGRLIKLMEPLFYKPYFNLKVTGVFLALIVVGISWAGGFFTLGFIKEKSGWIGFFLESFLIFTCLSINDLAKHAKKVYQALRQGDINLARKRVGEMVGRDTENLSESEILRATVESVAENSVDGVISPLFYAFLGGAPLALAYKAINTLDSMVGYKSERYLYFGWFSAKLDDLANFLPARISALLIPLVAFLLMRKGKGSLRIILRDGKKSPSPNAGIPEAGFAGALGIRLGGANFYQGKRENRPFIGDNLRKIRREDVILAVRLMQVLSFICLLVFCVLYLWGVWLV